MKVLVTEKIADRGVTYLRDAGLDVDVCAGLSPEELLDIIPPYDALIVRSATKVTRGVIEAGRNLKVIGRAGIDVDKIDVDAATERGIIVCNAPTSNVVSAAEETLALMLSIARQIPQANASMKSGKWERSRFVGNELQGKVLAIIGLGHVGTLVAKRAAAFGMDLIGYDPYCSSELATALGVTLYDDIDDICPLADFITVHLPKTRGTIGMFGRKQFSLMKNGVYLVNCARGGIFDTEVLADYVSKGRIAGAAIDVFEKEPCTTSPLHEEERIILTPHLGASTREAQDRAGVQIAEAVVTGLNGGVVETALNVTLIPNDVMEALEPYIAASQMAGNVIAQLAHDDLAALTVNIRGPLSNMDAHMLGTAALNAILSANTDETVNLVNADLIAEQRGIKVIYNQDPESTSYTNVIDFRAKAGIQEVEVGVTSTDADTRPRIVSLLDYDLDLIPGQHSMVVKCADEPGKLGIIGTLLGKHDINITGMEQSTDDAGGTAIVLMNINQEITDSIKSEIAEAIDADDAWYIHLS